MPTHALHLLQVEPHRPIATVRLPCQPTPSTCTILMAPSSEQPGGYGSGSGTMGGGGGGAALSRGVSGDYCRGGSSGESPSLTPAAAVAPSSSSRASSVSGAAARPVDSVVLAVATLAGLLYEYTVTGLLGGGTVSPAGTGAGGDTVVVLEGEWELQGSTSLIGG